MEMADHRSDIYYTTSSLSSEGKIHCKVDINNDETLRTRYCYIEKEVIDLAFSQKENDLISIIRSVSIFGAFFSKIYNFYYRIYHIIRKSYFLIHLILFPHFFGGLQKLRKNVDDNSIGRK